MTIAAGRIVPEPKAPRVLMVPIDGKLPNLALMRLAAWERSRGAEVVWRHDLPRRDLFTPEFDRVYGSAIFGTSTKAVAKLRDTYPHAMIGGSGGDADLRVEDIVPAAFSGLDYSGYPGFTASIGYPMVHIDARKVSDDHWRRLKQFQRWVIRGTYKVSPFDKYDPSFKRART